MKFLVLSALVAVATAADLIQYPNGAVAPRKTPEVLAAEAAHFSAKGAPIVAPGYLNPYYYNNGYYNHYAPAFYNGQYYNGHPFAYYNGGLVAYANGAVAPAKTAEVLQAEAEHFAAHGLPTAPIAPVGYAIGAPGLVAHSNGALVPVEPADVQAARADHLAAHASA